jgi:hypothetical protein
MVSYSKALSDPSIMSSPFHQHLSISRHCRSKKWCWICLGLLGSAILSEKTLISIRTTVGKDDPDRLVILTSVVANSAVTLPHREQTWRYTSTASFPDDPGYLDRHLLPTEAQQSRGWSRRPNKMRHVGETEPPKVTDT